MNDQAEDYYRAHLMVHEGTHCYMTIVPNPLQGPWYLEGMAEFFGTHLRHPGGKTEFGVLPQNREDFNGLGRIKLVRDAVSGGKTEEFLDVLKFKSDVFLKNEMYAWSWALCTFLEKHPRYRERFHKIEEHIRPGHELEDMQELYRAEWLDMQEEWRLFARNLTQGYNSVQAAIDFIPGRPMAVAGAKTQVAADRGWQSSEILVERDRTYEITATGQITVATKPKPWISEPQGVSIRYSDGHPVGQLLAAIRSEVPVKEPPHTTMLEVYPVGRRLLLKAPVTGTLYLRVNDFWNELSDNAGKYNVSIVPAK